MFSFLFFSNPSSNWCIQLSDESELYPLTICSSLVDFKLFNVINWKHSAKVQDLLC